MALVRQLITAGFRSKSKYEYIRRQPSKCYIHIQKFSKNVFMITIYVMLNMGAIPLETMAALCCMFC